MFIIFLPTNDSQNSCNIHDYLLIYKAASIENSYLLTYISKIHQNLQRIDPQPKEAYIKFSQFLDMPIIPRKSNSGCPYGKSENQIYYLSLVLLF